jgi:hypothetical protein
LVDVGQTIKRFIVTSGVAEHEQICDEKVCKKTEGKKIGRQKSVAQEEK